MQQALTTDKENVVTLIEALVAHGVERVVLSPGSRNTPLILAVARDKRLKSDVVIDERSAAFIALGMASQSGRPVALMCTSGSAVLNYAPAVAEAFYREIPLIIVSADRPRQWIDQDDSQTIRQTEILHNIVKQSCTVDVDSPEPSLRRMAVRDINDAMIAAVSGRPGPVHINIHLDTPLGRTTLHSLRPDTIRAILPQATMRMQQVRELADSLSGRRVMVIAGFMPPSRNLSRGLARLAACPGIAVLHEAQSNVHGHGLIGQIDRTLSAMSDDERRYMAPDVVITMGGSLVSRFIKTWLRGIPGLIHWHVGVRGQSVDCFNSLSLRIEMSPESLIPLLASACLKIEDKSDYNLRWHEIAARGAECARRYVSQAPWSDLTAIGYVIGHIPSKFNLHLSNGTAVRYVQLFDYGNIHRIDSNRGVSGIDGCTSTALGASAVYKQPTLLISGDMSAQYDIAAFSSSMMSPRFKMIVLNNGGGGIFRFIDSTKTLDELDNYIAGNVTLPMSGLAEAYGIRYFRADSMNELKTQFGAFADTQDAPAVLEIVTDGTLSAQVLTEYFKNTR